MIENIETKEDAFLQFQSLDRLKALNSFPEEIPQYLEIRPNLILMQKVQQKLLLSLHMCQNTDKLYIYEEVLPEDGWKQKVIEAGLSLISPREWYLREAWRNAPRVDKQTAINLGSQVMTMANIVSSYRSGVWGAAINRRL